MLDSPRLRHCNFYHIHYSESRRKQTLLYYRPVTLDDYRQVRDLLLAVGWGFRTTDESRLRRMISNADRTAGAWDDERLVGFARALCDEAFNGYIGTVC